jgi:hypothetical protein
VLIGDGEFGLGGLGLVEGLLHFGWQLDSKYATPLCNHAGDRTSLPIIPFFIRDLPPADYD